MNMKSITTCTNTAEKMKIDYKLVKSFEVKMLLLVIYQLQLSEVKILNSNLFTLTTKLKSIKSEVDEDFLNGVNMAVDRYNIGTEFKLLLFSLPYCYC